MAPLTGSFTNGTTWSVSNDSSAGQTDLPGRTLHRESDAIQSSTEHRTGGVGFCTPPAGGKKAWLACPPADASCGRRLHPPELPLSCRAGRPAAADRHAAASPAPAQRTLDIASALHCPERDTQETRLSLVWFV